MVSTNDYHSDYPNHWCPGCGNFGILDAMKSALAGLDLPPEKILIVSGIGQAAKTPPFSGMQLLSFSSRAGAAHRHGRQNSQPPYDRSGEYR